MKKKIRIKKASFVTRSHLAMGGEVLTYKERLRKSGARKRTGKLSLNLENGWYGSISES